MGKSDQLLQTPGTAARSLMHSKPPKAAGAGESQDPGQLRASDANGNSSGKQTESRAAGGFADLLQAVLSQQDDVSCPEPAYDTDALKPGRQISSMGAGRSTALQDVTNTQVKRDDHTPCSPSAPKALTVPGKQRAKSEQQAEPVVFTRRSARVKAKKEHSKPEHAHHSQEQSIGNTDIFGVNHQVGIAWLSAALDDPKAACMHTHLCEC